MPPPCMVTDPGPGPLAWSHLTHSFIQPRRRIQPVEKVGIELKAATTRAGKAPKSAYLIPDLGRNRAKREFFNGLNRPYSITSVNRGTKEPRPPKYSDSYCKASSLLRSGEETFSFW
jgi:hypothetical protein